VRPVSGTLVDAPLIRITIEPTVKNGLRNRSQVMLDKVVSVRRDKVGSIIGHLEAKTMLGVTRALAVFFAIA
jgi:mRNA interferase MazF